MTTLIPSNFGQFFSGWIASGSPEAQAAIAEIGQAGGNAGRVVGEVPGGMIDGTNSQFEAAGDFIPESVAVYLGIRLMPLADFVTLGTRTIRLTVPPNVGEEILIDYQQAS